MLTKLTAALLSLLAFSACQRIDRGVVVDKEHVPAHVETWWSTVCVSRDSNSTCTLEVPVQRSRRVPDEYTVWLSGVDEEGEKRTAVFSTTAEVYSWVRAGDSCDASSGRLLCNRGTPGEAPARRR